MAVGTFDPALSVDRDLVRYLIGDTGPTFVLDDVTLDALLKTAASPYCAAADAGESIVSRWNALSEGIVSKTVGRLSISTGSGAQGSVRDDYRQYIAKLRQRCVSLKLGGTALFKVL
jgi:hypothetical protein